MIGYGNNIELETKDGRKVLWAKMEGKDPVIQIVENKASFTSYSQWHEALAHTSKLNADLHTDGHLLPKTPKDFHCMACYLSKNVKHVCNVRRLVIVLFIRRVSVSRCSPAIILPINTHAYISYS